MIAMNFQIEKINAWVHECFINENIQILILPHQPRRLVKKQQPGYNLSYHMKYSILIDEGLLWTNLLLCLLIKKTQPFKSSSHAAMKAQYSLISSCSIFLVLNIKTKTYQLSRKISTLVFQSNFRIKTTQIKLHQRLLLAKDMFASQITVRRTDLFH